MKIFVVQTGKLTFRPYKHPVLHKHASFYNTKTQGKAVDKKDTSFSTTQNLSNSQLKRLCIALKIIMTGL